MKEESDDRAGTATLSRPDRVQVSQVLVRHLDASGCDWAWQGVPGKLQEWLEDTGPDDLDVWCAADPAEAAELIGGLRAELGCAIVAHSDDPKRLRHTSLAVETPDGLAVLDLTFGDLAVGPVTMLAAEHVTVALEHGEPILNGPSGSADLLIRPLLRGRLPSAARIEWARRRWQAAPATQQVQAAQFWGASLGRLSSDVLAVLGGATPRAYLARRARLFLVRRSAAPGNFATTGRHWRTVLPAGRAAGPLRLRTRGVVVALVGTDGSGKSTVARELDTRLQAAGLRTDHAYFGMARGNLPGVALARRALGIAAAGDDADTGGEQSASAEPVLTDPKADRPLLRRVAAYFYAAEYAWRYLSTVRPGRRRRDVVICDRYIYDLRESPWPGSLASRLAELVVPAPDVLALPDAPIELIHARKPERTLAEQGEQQGRLRDLLNECPADWACVMVDTSGETRDNVATLVAEVISAAHAGRGMRRP